MKVWRSGTTVWPTASARTSAMLGWTSRSAATGIELLEGVGQREVARGEQHGEVVEHVGRLLAHSLIGLRGGGAGHLLGFLLHLLPDPRRIREELGRVAAGAATGLALGDRALEGGQRLRGRGLQL